MINLLKLSQSAEGFTKLTNIVSKVAMLGAVGVVIALLAQVLAGS